MKIHILADNTVKLKGLGFLAEHGLSIFIEHQEGNVLFDTGQTMVAPHNAQKMKLDLNTIDHIVLSHGHYDHGGGLSYLPKSAKNPKIYIHPDALNKRYFKDKQTDIGISWDSDKWDVNAGIKKNLVLNPGMIKLSPHITLCAEIPLVTDFEPLIEGFLAEEGDKLVPDQMKDEQMLIYDTDKGLCLFIGCAHRGVINCLKYAMTLFPGKKIDTLIGGTHLNDVSRERLQKTIQYLADTDIKRIIPLHCTGMDAFCELKWVLGERCLSMAAGDSLEL